MSAKYQEGVAPEFDAGKDVASLRAEALRLLNLGLFALANLWVVYVTFVTPDAPFAQRMVPAALFVINGITLGLTRTHPTWAARIFPIQLTGLLMLYAYAHPGSLAIFMFVPIIVMAGVVVDRRWFLATVGAVCLSLALLTLSTGAGSRQLYGMATFVGVLTALASWMATRNLYVAVEWALYSHGQAQVSLAELRNRRAELRQMTDLLNQNQERMQYLNVRLEQAKVAAEEAYRTKQHFVANVSHELRTPLNLITGFSEMMAFSPESYGGVRLPASYQEDVMEIYRSSKHLLGLVEDVLALAQLEAGQMLVQREWTDLASVVRDAAETLRPLMVTKGLSLDMVVPADLPPVLMDGGRVRQILLNLLNNAYRFTERGGIRVGVRAEAQEFVVEVADTGVGIAPQMLPKVFEEFYTLSGGPTARRDGFGLGLSISRRLAEAHGGRLWVASCPGQGSTFSLSLPAAAAQEAPLKPTLVRTAARAAVERTRPVILEIGDEAGGDVCQKYLADYRVVHTTPRRALRAYEQYLPVAIWSHEPVDVDRPPRYLASILRRAPNIPVLACRVPTSLSMARQLRADLFLSKPITKAKLRTALQPLEGERPVQRVVVIDDDPRMLRLVQRSIESLQIPGCHALGACGGREGLEVLAATHPDVVLLDLAMPGVSGYDVLDAIYQDPAYTGMRVALMTGVEMEDETPIYSLSVASQRGFSLLKSLHVVKEIVDALSGQVPHA